MWPHRNYYVMCFHYPWYTFGKSFNIWNHHTTFGSVFSFFMFFLHFSVFVPFFLTKSFTLSIDHCGHPYVLSADVICTTSSSVCFFSLITENTYSIMSLWHSVCVPMGGVSRTGDIGLYVLVFDKAIISLSHLLFWQSKCPGNKCFLLHMWILCCLFYQIDSSAVSDCQLVLS